jgi:hypothetical protein
VAAGGRYARLYDLQARRFRDDPEPDRAADEPDRPADEQVAP